MTQKKYELIRQSDAAREKGTHRECVRQSLNNGVLTEMYEVNPRTSTIVRMVVKDGKYTDWLTRKGYGWSKSK